MTNKTYEPPSILPGVRDRGGPRSAARRSRQTEHIDPLHLRGGVARSNARDLGLNKDATGAHIFATLGAGMNSAGDPGIIARTQ